jgi:ABC-type Fe3+/spermidine/putrescine transport system ATPase subunit
MSIVLNQVTKIYGSQIVVNNVSLEIQPGELFVLLGASGSGKSTILRLIAGLMPLDGGRISLHGHDVTDLPPQKRNTGFVFQNYSLFRHMTIAQNIEFALSIRDVPVAERKKRVGELLDLIHLPGIEKRTPAQLSGGQQQRVALARALAHEPAVLLLDEPFGALDTKIRVQLRQNLREVQQRLKVTTILVTHDQEEAFELADRIGIIEQGQLLEVGVPDQLYLHPKHRKTATFLGTANIFKGVYHHRNGMRSEIDLGYVRVPIVHDAEFRSGQSVEVVFRPEELDLAPTPEQLQSEPLGKGIIKEVLFSGSLERMVVQFKDPKSAQEPPLAVAVDPTLAANRRLFAGSEVWVGYKRFHVI